MEALGQSLSIVLFLIAFVHFLWGLRIWVPVRDEIRLARTVVGAKGIKNMPSRIACFVVAGAVSVFGMLALGLSGAFPIPYFPDILVQIGSGGIALIFVARGIFGYTPIFAQATPEEPFRTYDRWYYSPLCLLIGGGFGTLIYLGAG